MNLRLLSVITLTVLTTFSACKKDSDSPGDPEAEIATHTDDQVRFSTETNAVANDANIAVESNTAFSGRVENITS